MRRAAIAVSAIPLMLSGSAAASIPKEQFIDRADAVCIRLEPRDRELSNDFWRADSDREAGKALRARADLYRRAARRIRGVPDPDKDAVLARRYVRRVVRGGEILEKAADAAASGNVGATNTRLADFVRQTDRMRFVADRFGFRHCGR